MPHPEYENFEMENLFFKHSQKFNLKIFSVQSWPDI